jgi:ZIP family zinc transporter
MVIGLTIFQGGAVGAAYLAAVFISNLPEAISSTTGLVSGGWPKPRVLWMSRFWPRSWGRACGGPRQ